MPFDDSGYIARYEAPPDSPYVAKLVLARDLIAAGWIQGDVAKKPEYGGSLVSCDPLDEGATKFCTIGALARAWKVDGFGYPDTERPDDLLLGFVNKSPDPIDDPFRENEMEEKVEDDLGFSPYHDIPDWNDNDDIEQKEVLAVFDKAIAFAREKGL